MKTTKSVIEFLKKVLKFVFGIFFKLPSNITRLWEKLAMRFLQGLILILILILCINFDFLGLFGPSPRLTDLKDPEISEASELYASNGLLIGKYFLENRSPVEFSDLSPTLVNSLLAAEDIRFYKHNGIDLKATVAAIWSTARGEKRGGSTITQQLVKNLYKTRHKNQKGLLGYIPGVNILVDKSKEWINALKLEFYYSKNDILTMYLNTVDFGSHAFGIKSAAATFFDKIPSELKPEEAALLIGLLKAPTYYSPTQNPENAIRRRNSILSQMERYGFIGSALADSLIKTRLTLRYRRSHDDDDASYFKEAVARSLQEWSKESGYNIYTDGLKIYTTIDPQLQKYAEQSVEKHMKRLQNRFYEHWQGQNPWIDSKGNEIPGFIESLAKETPYYEGLNKKFSNDADSISHYLNLPRKMTIFSWKGPTDTILSTMDSIRYYRHLLNTGFVSMDPMTGFIKAWVGGIDFRFFKFDHVNQARRQPGSLFKAFVYTAAFENGLGPCDRRTDQPVTIKYIEKGETKTWSPHNADWNFTWNNITLKNGFARSVNSIAVQLTNEMGWDKVIECAQRMGVSSPLRNVPSVCLGSSDVTLLEMVNAYCVFLNDGIKNEPVFVTKITDKEGKIIYEYKPKSEKVISSETAFLMSVMLRSGLTEAGGTTQGLWDYDLFRYDTEFGGKTGTSSNFSDGWFIGITPRLVSGVWVGGEHRNARFRTSQLGEGLRTALPVFGLYMESILTNNKLMHYRGKFKKPEIKITRTYTCSSYSPELDSLSENEPPAEFPDSL
ncbi:MAG: transglycosylase domain-containing protein [Bacteroidota bacterium]